MNNRKIHIIDFRGYVLNSNQRVVPRNRSKQLLNFALEIY